MGSFAVTVPETVESGTVTRGVPKGGGEELCNTIAPLTGSL